MSFQSPLGHVTHQGGLLALSAFWVQAAGLLADLVSGALAAGQVAGYHGQLQQLLGWLAIGQQVDSSEPPMCHHCR